MIFSILLFLKIILFANMTKVEQNRSIVLLLSGLIILFCFAWIYLSRYKKKHILAFSFYGIVSIIIFIDLMYYSHFNTLPSIRAIKQIPQLTAVGDSIKSLLTLKNLIFIIDIPLLIIYLKKWNKTRVYNKYIRWGVPTALGLTLIFLLIFLSSVGLFGPVTNQELFTYHAKDIKKIILKEELVEGSGIFTQRDLEELKTRTKL